MFECPLSVAPACFPQSPQPPLVSLCEGPLLARTLHAFPDVPLAQIAPFPRGEGRDGQCALTGAAVAAIFQVRHRRELRLELVVRTGLGVLRIGRRAGWHLAEARYCRIYLLRGSHQSLHAMRAFSSKCRSPPPAVPTGTLRLLACVQVPEPSACGANWNALPARMLSSLRALSPKCRSPPPAVPTGTLRLLACQIMGWNAPPARMSDNGLERSATSHAAGSTCAGVLVCGVRRMNARIWTPSHQSHHRMLRPWAGGAYNHGVRCGWARCCGERSPSPLFRT